MTAARPWRGNAELIRPPWPSSTGVAHSAAAALMVHGLYLGGVFVAITNGFPAALALASTCLWKRVSSRPEGVLDSGRQFFRF